MDGIESKLNLFGGHEHDSYNYHYHSHLIDSRDMGSTHDHTVQVLMRGAWAGNIESIPSFWSPRGKKVDVTGDSQYVGMSRR